MPWKEITRMSQRSTFIEQAKRAGANISALCRQYGISRKTAYKWLQRERSAGAAGLVDQSRRPQHSPGQTAAAMEDQVLSVRAENPEWGGRKIRRVLQNQGLSEVPAASTITAILRRHQKLDPEESSQHTAYQRFEREQPNALWQMDFKGHFSLAGGGECHPLTVIDDHSRFLVGLKACGDETYPTVQRQLTAIFRQYGLPERLLMDNGAPWGNDWVTHHTILTVWLLRLDIAVSHGRPRHPQTQGKDERLNRSFKAEVLSHQVLTDLTDSQVAFDRWVQVYNGIRPHEALQLDTPADHYTPSPRPFPEVLPPVIYDDDAWVRKVDQAGKISFHNRSFRIGKAFRQQRVALRPTDQDGLFDVFFCQQSIKQIDLRSQPKA